MEVFAKSKNLTEGRFTKPPDEPQPEPSKRQPLLPVKRQPSFKSEKNEIELPPWLQSSQALEPASSPGRSPSVKFVLPTQESPRKKRRRNATLYDAVAGRVGRHGFHKKKPAASKYRDTASTGERTLAPEEVLIRRPHYLNNKLKGEPYFAHERLPRQARLPTSEMLTALHAHAADFYKYGMQRTKAVHQSLDESALLAFGILTEELCRELMGPEGYRCLLDDPQHTDNEDEDNPIPDRLRTRKRRSEMFSDPNYRVEIRDGRARWIRKRKKRAKPATDTEKKKPRRRRKSPNMEWYHKMRQESEFLAAELEKFRQIEEEKKKKEREREERREERREKAKEKENEKGRNKK